MREALAVGAALAGLALLGLKAADLGTVILEQLMDVRLNELLSRSKHRPGVPTQVHLRDGTPLFVQVHQEPTSAGFTLPTPKAAES